MTDSTVRHDEPPLLVFEDGQYVYEDGTVGFEHVSFTCRPGELVGVRGPTGSGKSTLLREIANAPAELDVGWLVPAVAADVNDVMSWGAAWVTMQPVAKAPRLVLCDDAGQGLTNRKSIDAFHDTIYELCDRGSGVILASHHIDDLEMSDSLVTLGPGGVGARMDVLATVAREINDDGRPREATVARLEQVVERGAMPVIDNRYGAYVLLPRFELDTRQFASWATWFVIDAKTMRRLTRRHERYEARVLGERTKGRDRYLTWGDVAGTAAEVKKSDNWAWWPGKSKIEDRVEPRFALGTSYVRPHPLALDDEMCDKLLETHAHTGFSKEFTDDIDGDVFRRLMIGLECANQYWWGFEVINWTFGIFRHDEGDQVHCWAEFSPGKATLKLCAEVQLSNPDDYEGGDVRLIHPGVKKGMAVSRERGTLTVYPSWVGTKMSKISRGERWVLSIYGWGPPFR